LTTSLIKQGFPDDRRPYQIGIIDRQTIPVQMTINKFGTGMFEDQSNIEINIVVQRLKRDNIDPQLGNMEREVTRLISQYKQNDIVGIDKLYIKSMERIYEYNDDYSKSRWRTRIIVGVQLFHYNLEDFDDV